MRAGKPIDIAWNYVNLNADEKFKDNACVKYGLQMGIELLINFITICVVALLLDAVKECVIFILLFFPVRAFTGGLHLERFLTCYMFSTFSLSMNLLLLKNGYWEFGRNTLIIAVFIVLIVTCVIDLVEPYKNAFNKDLVMRRGRINRIIILLLVAIVVFATCYRADRIIYSMLIILSFNCMSVVLGKVKGYKKHQNITG